MSNPIYKNIIKLIKFYNFKYSTILDIDYIDCSSSNILFNTFYLLIGLKRDIDLSYLAFSRSLYCSLDIADNWLVFL